MFNIKESFMLLRFLVIRVDKTLRIAWKRLEGCSFFKKILKTEHNFGTIAVILAIQDLIPGKTSLLRNRW